MDNYSCARSHAHSHGLEQGPHRPIRILCQQPCKACVGDLDRYKYYIGQIKQLPRSARPTKASFSRTIEILRTKRLTGSSGLTNAAQRQRVQGPAGLLKLPLEIRQIIYQEVLLSTDPPRYRLRVEGLVEGGGWHKDGPRFGGIYGFTLHASHVFPRAVMLVNRQIHDEAETYVYARIALRIAPRTYHVNLLSYWTQEHPFRLTRTLIIPFLVTADGADYVHPLPPLLLRNMKFLVRCLTTMSNLRNLTIELNVDDDSFYSGFQPYIPNLHSAWQNSRSIFKEPPVSSFAKFKRDISLLDPLLEFANARKAHSTRPMTVKLYPMMPARTFESWTKIPYGVRITPLALQQHKSLNQCRALLRRQGWGDYLQCWSWSTDRPMWPLNFVG